MLREARVRCDDCPFWAIRKETRETRGIESLPAPASCTLLQKSAIHSPYFESASASPAWAKRSVVFTDLNYSVAVKLRSAIIKQIEGASLSLSVTPP